MPRCCFFFLYLLFFCPKVQTGFIVNSLWVISILKNDHFNFVGWSQRILGKTPVTEQDFPASSFWQSLLAFLKKHFLKSRGFSRMASDIVCGVHWSRRTTACCIGRTKTTTPPPQFLHSPHVWLWCWTSTSYITMYDKLEDSLTLISSLWVWGCMHVYVRGCIPMEEAGKSHFEGGVPHTIIGIGPIVS